LTRPGETEVLVMDTSQLDTILRGKLELARLVEDEARDRVRAGGQLELQLELFPV
jgi:hypothetical protein